MVPAEMMDGDERLQDNYMMQHKISEGRDTAKTQRREGKGTEVEGNGGCPGAVHAEAEGAIRRLADS
jgi:hypothetical protein